MQMLNQKKITKKNIKKSHILIFGSFLIFLGILLISYNHLLKIKDEVFSDMRVAISLSFPIEEEKDEIIDDVPIADNIDSNGNVSENIEATKPVDFSKYLGVLEIPRIGLKRGFFGIDSKYNNIEQNITLVRGSNMPDVSNGNLILMAHSGDAYISYFAYLYRLNVGNDIYVTYKGNRYHYRLVNIYDVLKNGRVKIVRNYSVNTLTLITCTKDDDTKQTVYIAELVS